MSAILVKVGSAIGLHARPAQIISEAAAELGTPVTLAVTGGIPVDASSALMIMTLGAGNGVEVIVEGDDDLAVQRIADLVAQDLDA
jgi:phosphocarrier protein